MRDNDMRKEQPAGVAAQELNAQKTHWEKTFAEKVDLFGTEPSYPARKAAALFKKEGAARILELGGGQGRDTLFFAQEGFQVYVLDYSREGVETIAKKASTLGLSSVVARQHDVRQPLPFPDDFFDGCFSHMLYCMALTTSDLVFLSGEIRRVLKLGRFNIYTVRNTTDAHYRTGVHRGEGPVGSRWLHRPLLQPAESRRSGQGIRDRHCRGIRRGRPPQEALPGHLKKASDSCSKELLRPVPDSIV